VPVGAVWSEGGAGQGDQRAATARGQDEPGRSAGQQLLRGAVSDAPAGQGYQVAERAGGLAKQRGQAVCHRAFASGGAVSAAAAKATCRCKRRRAGAAATRVGARRTARAFERAAGPGRGAPARARDSAEICWNAAPRAATRLASGYSLPPHAVTLAGSFSSCGSLGDK